MKTLTDYLPTLGTGYLSSFGLFYGIGMFGFNNDLWANVLAIFGGATFIVIFWWHYIMKW